LYLAFFIKKYSNIVNSGTKTPGYDKRIKKSFKFVDFVILDKTMYKLTKKIILVIAFSFFGLNPLLAQQEHEAKHSAEAHTDDLHAEKEFNPGEFAIEHVSDSYDWHITSIGEKHISIPLPVILYS